jgi:hypothetical protein
MWTAAKVGKRRASRCLIPDVAAQAATEVHGAHVLSRDRRWTGRPTVRDIDRRDRRPFRVLAGVGGPSLFRSRRTAVASTICSARRRDSSTVARDCWRVFFSRVTSPRRRFSTSSTLLLRESLNSLDHQGTTGAGSPGLRPRDSRLDRFSAPCKRTRRRGRLRPGICDERISGRSCRSTCEWRMRSIQTCDTGDTEMACPALYLVTVSLGPLWSASSRSSRGLAGPLSAPCGNSNPVFTPDGAGIVFASNRGGKNRSEIYVMDADGSHIRPLTDDSTGHPSFSPDWGRTILFTRFTSDSASKSGAEVWEMDSDGSSPRRLTDPKQVALHPSYGGGSAL